MTCLNPGCMVNRNFSSPADEQQIVGFETISLAVDKCKQQAFNWNTLSHLLFCALVIVFNVGRLIRDKSLSHSLFNIHAILLEERIG